MRFFLSLLFLILCSFSFAQPPDNNTEFAGDTIEGESTDTTIVYIIKKAPVTIKERIEIQGSKLRKHVYFSFGISAFVNSNTYKPRSGYNEYTKLLNTVTNPETGYSTIMQIYNAPEKNILGFILEGRRLNERFRFTPEDGQENTFNNSYTYGSFGVLVGRWYRKGHRISYQFATAPSINHKFGVSGYSINKDTISQTVFIEERIAYHKYYASLYLTCRLLYTARNSFIEIAPYAIIVPFSMTKKTEYFSVTRNIFGVSILLTRKIF